MAEAIEKLATSDLVEHWHSFCQCDPFPGSDTFIERMDEAGLIYLDDVDEDDLSDAFASELGIEPGGTVWRLTDAGRSALERAAMDIALAKAAQS